MSQKTLPHVWGFACPHANKMRYWRSEECYWDGSSKKEPEK